MRWLFVTTGFPWPIIHGRWLRVYHLARALCAIGDEVGILSCAAEPEGAAAYERIGAQVLAGPDRPHVSAGRGRVWLAPYAFDPALAEAVARHAGAFDVVALSGGRMLQYAPEASQAGCVLFELVDDPRLEGRRRSARGIERAAGLRRRVRRMGGLRYERRFLRHVRATVFVSQADCESFQARHPDAPAVCVPNGVDVDFFARPADWQAPPSQPPTVVFTGHMSNPNNQAASVYLVEQVAPLIWQRLPEVRVQLVGADPTPAVQALAGPRVEVTGRVDDIRPFLWNASVVLLSMQSGTGIKNKLLEAWAAGAAVVATPLACQGIPVTDGGDVLVAQTPAELASAAVRVMTTPSLREALGQAGRQVVAGQLTWRHAAEGLGQAAGQRRSAAWV